MTPADRVEFARVMAGMSALYQHQLTPEALDLYWLALAPWSLADFKRAAGALVRSSRFMPRPADFEAIRKAALPTPAEAWTGVLEHIRGAYRDGNGLDPVTDRAVRCLGGYGHLARLPVSELHWQAKRFAEVFGELGEADVARDALPEPVRMALARTALE